MLSEPIGLPIYFDTKESKEYETINGLCNLDLCEIRKVYLYRIDYVVLYRNDEKDKCMVCSGGEEFIVKKSVLDTIEAINEHIKKIESKKAELWQK